MWIIIEQLNAAVEEAQAEEKMVGNAMPTHSGGHRLGLKQAAEEFAIVPARRRAHSQSRPLTGWSDGAVSLKGFQS
jgi:hypothetical protein